MVTSQGSSTDSISTTTSQPSMVTKAAAASARTQPVNRPRVAGMRNMAMNSGPTAVSTPMARVAAAITPALAMKRTPDAADSDSAAAAAGLA